ncbi:alpha/beta hydrolase fold domain-containing protein [Rosistilla ulvae]|nr:alpha/beta hydrolase fold domain-containing protein [Rosistilla ulvae]
MKRTQFVLVGIALLLLLKASANAQTQPAIDQANQRKCLAILESGLESVEFWPSMHAAEALTMSGEREKVRRHLGRLDWQSLDDQKRCGVFRELVRSGDAASVSMLYYILANPKSTGRVHAAESIFKLNIGNNSNALADAAKSDDEGLALFSAAALARRGDSKALSAVRAALSDPSSTMRRRAAWILSTVGDATDQARLHQLLPGAVESLERVQYQHSLAALGDVTQFRSIQANLIHSDPRVRASAAVYAGECNLDSTAELIQLLDDEALDVRIRAAHRLLASVQDKPHELSEKVKRTAQRGDHIRGVASFLKPDRKLTYKTVSDRDLQLHVFLPENWNAANKRSCFLIIHGGGWAGGVPQRMYPFADYFANQGMVAISLQYRLLDKKRNVDVFDCVRDARSAVRFIRTHAEELGVDPNKIIVSGASAGGHLAVGTSLFRSVNEAGESTAVSCEPNALVLLYPVIDTSSEGYGQAKIGARWKELSPVAHVKENVSPTIVFHGTADTVTPLKGAEQFTAAMAQLGNECSLVRNDGGAHGYLIYDLFWYFDAQIQTEQFLKKHKLLKKQ